jgi:predicted HD phosphohydrolase
MSATSHPAKTADDIIALLEERGKGDYIGESISQLEHSLQAANFAAQAGKYI